MMQQASNGSYSNNDSHGTCCSGIISAVNNTIGIKGIAFDAKIIPIRISWGQDHFYDINMIEGFQFALDENVDVISCSWGGGSNIPNMNNIINKIVGNGRNGLGCPVLFASGNNNTSTVFYPASLPSTIAVGAISPCGERKHPSSCDGENNWGSNYGQELDVVAPGVLIPTTTINSSYNLYFNGTSSACPHAAGVMALILSANPCLTQLEARAILSNSCDKIGNYDYSIHSNKPYGTWNNQMGYGKINAYKAVSAALATQSYSCSGSGVTSNVTDEFAWMLSSTYSGLAAGWYYVKRHEITKNISFPYVYEPMVLVAVNGFSMANPNNGEYYFTISNLTNTSATLKTWVYEVLYNINGQYVNKFVPANPNNVQFNVLVMDIPEIETNISNQNISQGVYNRQAYNSIYLNNFTVTGNSNVSLRSGNSIIFQDNVIISPESTGKFIAYIEPFNPCPQEVSILSSDYSLDKNTGDRYFKQDTLFQYQEELLKVYPNPNTGNFFIELPAGSYSEISKIQIKDIMGKTVYEKANCNTKEISLKGVQQGLYFVIVTLKDKVLTQKIIIK